MIAIAPKTLLMIVGLLALAAILFYLALQIMGLDITEIPYWAQRIEYPLILGGEGMGVLTESFTDLDFDKEHTTATEIACAIAQSIRSDFLQYGDGSERPLESGNYRSLTPIEPDKTIVDRGSFRIKWNAGRDSFWAFSDLSTELQQGLMAGGICSDTGESWSCSKPYLDEECISKALRQFKVGDNYFCTGRTNAKISAGGALVHFGNDDCGGDRKVADNTDNCEALCPGADKIKVWNAPGGTLSGYNVEYVDDTKLDESYNWPPRQCLSEKCEPLYSWILVWNNKKKAYEIDIGRMPERVDLGGMSTGALVNKLLEGGHKYRNIKSAFPYPELRTRYDLTFSPTNEDTLTGLLTKFTDELGKDWSVEIEECWGAECYETEVVKKEWKHLWEVVWRWAATAPWEYDQSKDNSKKRKELRTVTVRTNIENPNELLKTDHTYRVVMRWWRVTIGHGERTPDCGIGTGVRKCVWCLESGGSYVGERWASDCQNEPDDLGGYSKSEKYTRYQDLSLIIVDMGPAEGAAPPEE